LIKRFLAFILFATVLLGLILYSQWRTQPNYVSGVIETDEIRLGSRVAGRVKTVLVAEGDQVAAGDQLVAFEPYDLNERLQQAVAVLAEREAALQKMKSGSRSQEIAQAKSRFDQATANLNLVKAGPRPEEIAAAKSRVGAANSERELAQLEYDRIAELFQSNAVPKAEFDRASERLSAAIAQLNVRENELKILESGARQQEIEVATAQTEDARQGWELAKLGFRQEDIDQATAARDAAKAALDAVRAQQNELTIVAPVDGYVDALDLQSGDLVAPNAPVMTLLAPHNIWVRIYVPQRFMQLKLGQQLRVKVDSFPNHEFVGKVTFISHQAEFTPSNVQTPDDRAKQVYRVRVSLDVADGQLRPGMTANVWLEPVDAAP
jgi:multidrug resistance efflux pump